MNEPTGVPPDRAAMRRGIGAVSYSEHPWIIGQYSGFGGPVETNLRFRRMIAAGQKGLGMAMDLPTQLGLDPDHPAASGEVGRVGVSVANLDDLDALFQEIDLGSVRQITTTANSIGPAIIAMFIALARRRGIDPNAFAVRVQNDVLKEYVARGTQILPPDPAVDFAVDAVEYCCRNLPRWIPMSICGYHIRDAGSTREQEIGLTLAHAREYLRRSAERGVSPADFAKAAWWFLSASPELLDEVCKFRAARELWATMLRDEFGVTEPAALSLRISVYTLGGALSAFEITNNSVRVTLAALAAVLGGAQAIYCSSVDEALGLPTEDSARLAVRTQQVILHESGLAAWVDPLGDASLIERRTTEIFQGAVDVDRLVTEHGGAVEAVKSGWTRLQIDESAWAGELVIREHPRVGEPSRTVADPVPAVDVGTDDGFSAEGEERRCAEFAEWKRHRDASEVGAALSTVQRAIQQRTNLVEPLADAFFAGASIGEAMRLLMVKHGAVRPSLVMAAS